ncbi:MAG TPA: DNA/RNA non-specific endonuclease [Nitrospiraceae bacterium]|nr:DNA/RNA non-specific endonuclease [Nitrospiraceae bacterium]
MRIPARVTIWCLQLMLVTALASAAPLDHCQEYLKYGIPGAEGDLLCRKGYVLAHNPDRKTPDWVAEHLTIEKVSATMDRKNYFQPDPELPPGKRAELADYKNSGYDRGNMAPPGDMRWDLEAYKESFYLSNVAPQVGRHMNRGIWAELEEKVREWAKKRGELYVYTGPIYDELLDTIETIGVNDVAIPSHFYKIIFDPGTKEAIAFMMPNDELRTSDLPKYIVSVDMVEAETGLNFLSTLDAAVQARIESKKAAGLWK